MPPPQQNQPLSDVTESDDPHPEQTFPGPTKIILKRWDNGAPLWHGDAANVKEALFKATETGTSLAFIDLTGADLDGIELPSHTDLQNACLKQTRFSKSLIQNVNFLNAILDDGSTVIAPHVNAHLKANVVAFSTNWGLRYKSETYFADQKGIRKILEQVTISNAEYEKQCQWIEACENQGKSDRLKYAVGAIAESGAAFNFGTLSDPRKQSGDCIDIEAEITVDDTTFACCGGQIICSRAGGDNSEPVVDFIPAINNEIGKLLQHFGLDRERDLPEARRE